MADEQSGNPGGWARLAQCARNALWLLLEPTISLGLLAVAIIEALLSPFLGWHFALAGMATAAVAVGLILAHGALGIQYLGSWAPRIHEQLISLHDEEVKKLTEPQRRAAPEKPLPSWKN
jgi:hypothetical protein